MTDGETDSPRHVPRQRARRLEPPHDAVDDVQHRVHRGRSGRQLAHPLGNELTTADVDHGCLAARAADIDPEGPTAQAGRRGWDAGIFVHLDGP
jgi:hypothetical protein